MSDNGKDPKTIIEVKHHENGTINIKFAPNTNLALISHAMRLLNINLDNMIMQRNMEEEAKKIQVANTNSGIISQLRKRK